VASRTLSFPPRPAVDAPAPQPSACTIVPFPDPTPVFQPRTTPAPAHGLHLVTEAPQRRRFDSAARARSIVAQVEWEIEQQAARYRAATFRLYKFGGPRPSTEQTLEMVLAPGFEPRPEPIFERETPLVVLRRVVRSLMLSFQS
jgi:hypothetical protein